MISKELLSAVYPIDETAETYVGIQESTGRVMWFGKEYNDCRSEIDIHRVAHKCKEWAYNQGYSYLGNNKLCNIHSKDGTIIALTNNNISKWYDINIDFIACQWILDKGSK